MDIEFVSSKSLQGKRWETDGVLIVMPFTRPAEARRTAQLMARRSGTAGLLVGVYDEGMPGQAAPSPPASAAATADVADAAASPDKAGFVALVNAVFRSSASPWFCYVAQDAFPGRQWLSIALAGLEYKGGLLAAFNDGKWHGRLASFGLARRTWAEKLYDGDFFFPGYARHYADVELTVLAIQQEGFVYTPESVLVEIDWEKDAKPVSRQDRALYLSRVEQQFDGRVNQPTLLERFR